MSLFEFSRKWIRRWFRNEAPRSGHGNIYFHVDQPGQRPFHFPRDRQLTLAGWAFDSTRSSVAKIRIRVGRKVYVPRVIDRPDVQSVFSSTFSPPPGSGFEAIVKISLGINRIEIVVESEDLRDVSIYETIVIYIPRVGHSEVPSIDYKQWKRASRKLVNLQLPEIQAHITAMPNKPSFAVIIDAAVPDNLVSTLDSLKKQVYPNWSAVVFGKNLSSLEKKYPNIRISERQVWSAPGADFLTFLKSGDRLEEDALYAFASRLNEGRNSDLIYGDEEIVDSSSSQITPFHKPDWSPDYLETFNYIGRAACFRSAIATKFNDVINYYDFVLRFCEQAKSIEHLPFTIVTRLEDDNFRESFSNTKALKARLVRTHRHGDVAPGDEYFNYFRIALERRETPLVSIVIPTAGRTVSFEGRQLDLIVNCVEQIRRISTYKNIEIVIVDNGDLSATQLDFLKAANCRLITFTEAHFNIAKKLNLGASIASGEFLLLLNDDIELLTPEWIERMLEQFEKPHVGVVGCKLLYPDLTTQHVGVVFNYNNPDHVRRLRSRSEHGYFFSTAGVRNYLAVTGACMMTRADVYREVRGYSEALSVSFNDVDYCLKVRQLGLFSVYTGQCELIHLESQTRQASLNPDELRWFLNRWSKDLTFDPFYNERFLTVARPTFELVVNQRQL